MDMEQLNFIDLHIMYMKCYNSVGMEHSSIDIVHHSIKGSQNAAFYGMCFKLLEEN